MITQHHQHHSALTWIVVSSDDTHILNAEIFLTYDGARNDIVGWLEDSGMDSYFSDRIREFPQGTSFSYRHRGLSYALRSCGIR